MLCFYFIQNFDELNLLPRLALMAGRCEDETCKSRHGVGLEIGWLFWTHAIVWSPGHDE